VSGYWFMEEYSSQKQNKDRRQWQVTRQKVQEILS
jgi:hypothetical protein